MNRVSFETTQWTVILAAAESQAPGAEEALSTLCQRYWAPLYYFVRRRGYSHEDAQDLTQEFFARLIENSDLKQVDRARGRFRSFLLASIRHFLSNEWHHAQTQKRGGGWAPVPVTTSEEAERVLELCHQESPEKTYERKWAQALLERVLSQLRAECAEEGKAEDFEVFKPFLTGQNERGGYVGAAEQLGISEGAAKVAVHRLRKRYRRLLKEEVRLTVGNAEEVEEEIASLIAALSA